MAMIICPECGKEISDRASSCPNCGCPVEKSNEQPKKEKINVKIIILVVAVLVLVAALSILLINNSRKKAEAEKRKDLYESALSDIDSGEYSDAVDKLTEVGDYEDAENYLNYADALSKCYEGNYSGAYKALSELNGFKDSATVMEQLYYESRLLGGMARDVKDIESAKKIKVKKVDLLFSKSEETVNPRMVMIADYSGIEEYYYWLLENDDSSDYSLFGSCTSLNIDDYGDDADAIDLFTAKIISGALNSEDVEVKSDLMNYDRLNKVIQSGNYSTIKSID